MTYEVLEFIYIYIICLRCKLTKIRMMKVRRWSILNFWERTSMSFSSTAKREYLHHLESTPFRRWNCEDFQWLQSSWIVSRLFWIRICMSSINAKCTKITFLPLWTYYNKKSFFWITFSYIIITSPAIFVVFSPRNLGSKSQQRLRPKALSQQRLWKPFVWSGLWRDRVPSLRFRDVLFSWKLEVDKQSIESTFDPGVSVQIFFGDFVDFLNSEYWVTDCNCIGFGICKKRFKCYKTQLVTWDGPVLGDIVKIIPKGQRLKTGKRPIWHIEIHSYSCLDLEKR